MGVAEGPGAAEVVALTYVALGVFQAIAVEVVVAAAKPGVVHPFPLVVEGVFA